MLDLARKSLLGKAMVRPDLVRQVVNKVRTEGIGEAYRQTMGVSTVRFPWATARPEW